MTNIPSSPAGSRPSVAEFAEMAARLDRMDRRIEGGCATAAGLFSAGGTGVLASAVHRYAVVCDGPMASAGVALATALFVVATRPGSCAVCAPPGVPRVRRSAGELPLRRGELRYAGRNSAHGVKTTARWSGFPTEPPAAQAPQHQDEV